MLVVAAARHVISLTRCRFDTPSNRDELFGFLIAGHDTTAATLAWAVKCLADHQDVQQKLRSALRAAMPTAVLGNTSPSAQEIAGTRVPYLEATIQEVLRNTTTAPGLMRVTTQDTQIFGHHIPKGTDVFCMNTGPDFKSAPMPVDEKLRSASSQEAKGKVGSWDVNDMGDFRPERWLVKDENGEEVFDSKAGPFMTFGLGPRGCFGKWPVVLIACAWQRYLLMSRACVGKKLAYLQMRITITLLLWNFELQTTPAELSSYRAVDKMVHNCQQCYVRLAPI